MQDAQDAKRSAEACEDRAEIEPNTRHGLTAGEAKVLHDMAPSPAWYRQASYALGAPFAPEPRFSEPAPELSRLESLNHVLRRALSKKAKQKVIKSISGELFCDSSTHRTHIHRYCFASAPIPPELDDESSVTLEAGPSKTPDVCLFGHAIMDLVFSND